LKPKQKDINFDTPKKDIARNIEINDDFFLDDEGFTPISESEEAPF
jgi:hypothetical protein